MSVTLGQTDTVKSIRQCIRIILTTTKGEVPWRPNFGLSPEQLLDGQAEDVDISFAVIEQLTKYEPRIKVKKVSVANSGPGQKNVTIEYTIKEFKADEILTLDI